MSPPPELSRRIALDRIGSVPVAVAVEADAAERAAVAARLRIEAVESLRVDWSLRRDGQDSEVILAEGRMAAVVVQVSVVSLEPFAASVEELFRIKFIPEDRPFGDDDPESDDELAYSGTALDVGEATVQQLALALDPYPREPGAEADLPQDSAVGPFAALERRARKGY